MLIDGKFQDLFEATAEITDANPCISVTLRLLSLQNKGCICVDEIYVFGDPVVPADSERQESYAENSSGSSLMTMFLPTLMQLSKTTGLSRSNEKYPPVRKEKQYFSEVGLGKSHPSDSVIKTQLEEKASITDHHEVEQQKVNEDSVGPSQTDIPLQDAPMESKHNDVTLQAAKMETNSCDTPSQAAKVESNSDSSSQTAKMDSNHSDTPSQAATMESKHGDSLNGNVERTLEQLVSRMDRIERICLGFQEKMLMPISSIEARLKQVEQQLETLTVKLQNSGLPSCSRVYPPDNSCIQSDANSCDNCHVYNVTGGIKSDKKSSHIEVLSVFPNVMSDSTNTTQLLPGLVVTAPEFPDGEDEEENNALGSEMNSSKDKQRQNLSIDDAVASALAGFLSSVSLETPRYTKSLTVRAPEFTTEDDHENNDASPTTLHEIEKNDLVHLKDTESIPESTSHNIHMERGEMVNRDPNDKQSDETAKEAEHSGQLCTGEDDQVEVGVEATTLAEHNPRTGFDHTPDDNKTKNISCQTSDGLYTISDNAKLHQIDVNSSTTQGEVGASTDLADTVATEVPKRASHEDIIENYLGFSRGSSMVDFKIPILDVQFTSQKNSATKSILEALLVDTPETNFQNHPMGESSDDHPIKEQLKSNGDLSAVEQYNLVSVDVDDPANPVTNSHFSVDRDYDTLINVPVDVEGDNMQEDHKRSYDEIASSSLI